MWTVEELGLWKQFHLEKLYHVENVFIAEKVQFTLFCRSLCCFVQNLLCRDCRTFV